MSQEGQAGSPATLPQRLLWGLLALMLAFLLYALSVGPLIAVGNGRSPRVDSLLHHLEDPLLEIADAARLHQWLNAYQQWWFDRFKRNEYRSFGPNMGDIPSNPQPGEEGR